MGVMRALKGVRLVAKGHEEGYNGRDVVLNGLETVLAEA